MIQAVTFDFWQTLMADTPENLARATALRIQGVGEALGRSGHPVEAEALRTAYEACGERLGAVWQEHRDLLYREQVAIFIDTAVPGLSQRLPAAAFEEAVQAYIGPALTYPPLPSRGAVEAVRTLASQGVLLCVVSNTGRTPGVVLRRLLARIGLLEHFCVTTFSDEVGVRKPRSEIFQVTLARAGVEAARSVHVGDMPEADVAGAHAAGMRAVHFAPDGRRGSEAADLVIDDFGILPAELARLA